MVILVVGDGLFNEQWPINNEQLRIYAKSVASLPRYTILTVNCQLSTINCYILYLVASSLGKTSQHPAPSAAGLRALKPRLADQSKSSSWDYVIGKR